MSSWNEKGIHQWVYRLVRKCLLSPMLHVVELPLMITPMCILQPQAQVGKFHDSHGHS